MGGLAARWRWGWGFVRWCVLLLPAGAGVRSLVRAPFPLGAGGCGGCARPPAVPAPLFWGCLVSVSPLSLFVACVLSSLPLPFPPVLRSGPSPVASWFLPGAGRFLAASLLRGLASAGGLVSVALSVPGPVPSLVVFVAPSAAALRACPAFVRASVSSWFPGAGSLAVLPVEPVPSWALSEFWGVS